MKNACNIFLGLFLMVCLTLYGPFSIAKAEAGAVFSIEICADGVATTVLIGADGHPVEPAQHCADCLTCCEAGGVVPAKLGVAPTSFALVGISVGNLSAQDPILNTRNIIPAPRGPPAVLDSLQNVPELIARDHLSNGHKMRSDGRPHLKDADA